MYPGKIIAIPSPLQAGCSRCCWRAAGKEEVALAKADKLYCAECGTPARIYYRKAKAWQAGDGGWAEVAWQEGIQEPLHEGVARSQEGSA